MQSDSPQEPHSGKCVVRRSVYVSLLIAAIVSGFSGWSLIRISFEVNPYEPYDTDIGVLLNGGAMLSTVQAVYRKTGSSIPDTVQTALFLTIGAVTCGIFATAVRIAELQQRDVAPNASLPETMQFVCLAILFGSICGVVCSWLLSLGDGVSEPLIRDEPFLGRVVRWEYHGIMRHAVISTLFGCGIALATCLALRWQVSAWKLISGAVVGGLVAAFIYPFLAAMVFPLDDSHTLIPTGGTNQLAWMMSTTMLIAIGMCRALSRSAAR